MKASSEARFTKRLPLEFPGIRTFEETTCSSFTIVSSVRVESPLYRAAPSKVSHSGVIVSVIKK